MVDGALAVEFVGRHGDDVERARLRHLLAGASPPPAVVAALLAGQRADGGWPPFWAPDYSSLDATCFRLARAEALGLTTTEPALAGAVRFLADRQRADGGWEEDAAVREVAPPWAAPGDE
ncbi:MAG: squalene--hopene cyclase, partial [Chloroflexota bacterium]|nr:squalene--hopene cyclase [Chloroflexota bacterium]